MQSWSASLGPRPSAADRGPGSRRAPGRALRRGAGDAGDAAAR
jgi:hypothetical protein